MSEHQNAMRMERVEAAPGPGVNAPTGQAPASQDQGRGALQARIAALGPQQRALAANRAEILGAVGHSLAGRSYVERRAILAHLGPRLVAQGIPAGVVARFDPTDANLAAIVRDAGTLRALLAPPPALLAPGQAH